MKTFKTWWYIYACLLFASKEKKEIQLPAVQCLLKIIQHSLGLDATLGKEHLSQPMCMNTSFRAHVYKNMPFCAYVCKNMSFHAHNAL